MDEFLKQTPVLLAKILSTLVSIDERLRMLVPDRLPDRLPIEPQPTEAQRKAWVPVIEESPIKPPNTARMLASKVKAGQRFWDKLQRRVVEVTWADPCPPRGYMNFYIPGGSWYGGDSELDVIVEEVPDEP